MDFYLSDYVVEVSIFGAHGYTHWRDEGAFSSLYKQVELKIYPSTSLIDML